MHFVNLYIISCNTSTLYIKFFVHVQYYNHYCNAGYFDIHTKYYAQNIDVRV